MPPMKFLVICPATVLQHWNREMNAWNPLARSIIMHSISPTFNEILSLGENGIRIALEDIFEQEMSYTGGTVVITTYDTFRTFREILLGVDWSALTSSIITLTHEAFGDVVEIPAGGRMAQTIATIPCGTR